MFKKISLSVLMCLPALALADFNPYAVFNSNTSSSTSSGTSANSTQTTNMNNTAPMTNSSMNAASATQASPSPYVQPAALTRPASLSAPATAPAAVRPVAPNNPGVSSLPYPTPSYPHYAAPASAPAVTPYVTPTSGAPNGANTIVPSIPPMPAGSGTNTNPSGVVPNSGSSAGGSILQQINQGVQTINTNLSTWQAQEVSAQTAAGAQLVPSSTTNLNDFLANQTGYRLLTNLPVLSNSVSLSSLIAAQNANGAGSGTSAGAGSTIGGGAGTNLMSNFQQSPLFPSAFLLFPTTVSNMAALTSSSSAAQNNFLSFGSKYAQLLMGFLPQNSVSLGLGYQSTIFSLIGVDLAQIASQTKPVGPVDSQMSLLQSAVNAPFSPVADPSSGQTWFQQLSTASTPQVLRNLAILIATQNQMEYTQLQNLQTMNMMHAGQLTELAAIDQGMNQMAAAQQQTNALLQKLISTLVAQGGNK